MSGISASLQGIALTLPHDGTKRCSGILRSLPLERVMNLAKNRTGMRIIRLAGSPATSRFPLF